MSGMNTNNGGPAFPVSADDGGAWGRDEPGLSVRDYFAAAALQGLAASQGLFGDSDAVVFAERVYALADAMLAERSKPR